MGSADVVFGGDFHDLEVLLNTWGENNKTKKESVWSLGSEDAHWVDLSPQSSPYGSSLFDASPSSSLGSEYPSPFSDVSSSAATSSSSEDESKEFFFQEDHTTVNMLEVMDMVPSLPFEEPFCDSGIEQLPLFETTSLPLALEAEITSTSSPSTAFQGSVLPPLPSAKVEEEEEEEEAMHTMSKVKEDKEKEQQQQQQEEEEMKKKSKKRRRSNFKANSSKEKPVNFVELSADELLKLDSEEIEKYIKDLAATRSMAPSEERELKRVRRLIKNREYAQSSRNKKKQYMEEMESKLQVVIESKVVLQQKINALEMENRSLKQQLAKIGTVLKQNPDFVEKIKKKAQPPPTTTTTNNMMRNGTVLFALLLFTISFGWFSFLSGPTPMQANNGPVINKWHTGRVLLGDELIMTEEPASYYAIYTPQCLQDFVARHLGYTPLAPPSEDDNQFHFRKAKHPSLQQVAASVVETQMEELEEEKEEEEVVSRDIPTSTIQSKQNHSCQQ